MDLSGKRVVVTGGSSGNGLETCRLFGERGARVVTCGRSQARLDEALSGMPGIERAVEADLSTPEGVSTMVEAVKQQMGGCDILINNAGYGEFERVDDLSWEAFSRVFAVNVFGAAMLTQGLVSGMRAQRSGTIINIGSTSALKGFALGSMYSASKFALRGMTQSWQEELRRFNIRVTQVNPSEVTTAFGNPNRRARPTAPNRLAPTDIARTIVHICEQPGHVLTIETTLWATNPF